MNATQLADDLRAKVRAGMPEVRAGLERLARVPSMSAPGYDPAPVRESAKVTAELFNAVGIDARVVTREGAHPAVVGRVEGPTGSPTVLLYAHHDVQPPGPRDRWTSDPFTPTERDGRLYGRGVADDKAGIATHLAALRAYGGRPPCGVALFIEGEEESGSAHLVDFLEAEKDTLRCDAVIIADSANWRIGQPAITTTLRGNALVTVELRVSDHAVHSGAFGGAVPDALMAMTRMLASLHDDQGRVAVKGLKADDADPLDLREDELRRWVGTRPSVKLIGDGSITSRLWRKPSISIIGLDATPVREASNTLWPVATARLSMRVPPGQDAKAAQDALVKHLETHAPWGAELKITRGPTGEAFTGTSSGPAYAALKEALGAAWGREAIDIGQGGSIPFLFDFARSFPGAALLVTGVEDPESNAHSENESLHLAEFENVAVAEATFLGLFGASRKA
ncbi:MAG: cysteinylglycine-S-conjugate dipeptidase [Chloroflexota bacterium]|nr:cysteinylglycine-S-conjugate dipeptidase [Chloroflexota bacterium]